MLAFLEAPVATVMEAVPIARAVFVVRVPALDKESEAKLTASALLLPRIGCYQDLASGGGVTASQTGFFALALFWGSCDLGRKDRGPGVPRENSQVGLLMEKGLCSYGRN